MASFAIILCPLLALVLFSKSPPAQAIIWSVLVPYLFLPEGHSIPLPGLPDITKTSIISISLVIGYFAHKQKFVSARAKPNPETQSRRFQGIMRACVAVFLIGICLTVVNNPEPLRYGPTFIPGLRLWDIVSLLGDITLFVLPFFFALRYLDSPQAHRELLKALAIMGIIYSALMLVEIRLSPQLHNWVYGFHQHSFLQHVREGYRPKVFLQHGLWVGFFIFMTCMATAAMYKSSKQLKWLILLAWLLFILMISENLGAWALGAVFLTAFFLTGRRMQLLIGAVLAGMVLLYPTLRSSNVIPLDRILSVAAMASEDRASSLEYRLRNEDLILERVYEKPLTGWGTFGRDRLYDEGGNVLTISEGRWIQTLGSFGWLGYSSFFAFLTMPVFFVFLKRWRDLPPPETVVLSLIIAGNLLYMVPNSTLTPVCWLVFGALAGYVRYGGARVDSTEDTDKAGPRPIRYTRFDGPARTR